MSHAGTTSHCCLGKDPKRYRILKMESWSDFSPFFERSGGNFG